MNSQKCTTCGIEKTLDCFHFRNKKLGTHRYECKECYNDKKRKQYQNNKNLLIFSRENTSCEKCGYDKCLSALEFHHIDEFEKVANVSKLATKYDIELALKESEKCVLLCANCHREFHYMEYNYNMTIQEFLHK